MVTLLTVIFLLQYRMALLYICVNKRLIPVLMT